LQPSELQLSVRLPGARKTVGARLVVPAGVTAVPGPAGSSYHAIEDVGGVVIGELDLAFITPDLIMDRSGVLREAARRTADAFVAPPRDGALLGMREIELPSGPAFRVDALLQRGADGRPPALPVQTVLVMGHPDLRLPLAVIVTLTRTNAGWPKGEEIVESLELTGAPAGAARDAILLPFTSG
jgi:hypothetical protein